MIVTIVGPATIDAGPFDDQQTVAGVDGVERRQVAAFRGGEERPDGLDNRSLRVGRRGVARVAGVVLRCGATGHRKRQCGDNCETT